MKLHADEAVFLMAPQPLPSDTDPRRVDVFDFVISRGFGADPSAEVRRLLAIRAQQGREHYGTSLGTHNGRDHVIDALQELVDAYIYLSAATLEATDVPESRMFDVQVAEIREDIHWTLRQLLHVVCNRARALSPQPPESGP